ncbi:hypothetical protein HanXRQr2_Chr12g0536821 [Helianthus annuus]|uniref:Uncharacterized protein n=1 Tax=Helianthus annuus TaxID=4232 RepID=A0A9K3MVM1_HELAN|nr:hypothetical protein HanXRQr2_Chr12g0536821 [Helianthus annuus]
MFLRSKNKGTSFQPNPSGYSTDTEKEIFIRKAQSEKLFTTKKRSRITRKKKLRENKENKEVTTKGSNN